MPPKKKQGFSCKAGCVALHNLPRKLKVLLILCSLLFIFCVALLAQAAKAYNYSFPKDAGMQTDHDNAKTFQHQTLKWSGGPGIPLLACVLFGLYGSARRNRVAIMTYVVLGAICFVLSAIGFSKPVNDGAWSSFSDACACTTQHCCDLGDQCTGDWHRDAYQCDAGTDASWGSCPAGKFSPTQSGECLNCTHGTYKAQAGTSCCLPCASLKTTLTVGATGADECTLCDRACPAGHHGSAASGVCVPCPANFFKAEGGNSCCAVCPPGAVSAAGATECTPPNSCPSGEFHAFDLGSSRISPLNWLGDKVQCKDTAECQPCPSGKFGSLLNSFGYCQGCPGGKFQALSGQEQCADCPAGQFSDSLVNPGCKGCTRGRFSSAGQEQCSACPTGQTSTAVASACATARRLRLLDGSDADADAEANAREARRVAMSRYQPWSRLASRARHEGRRLFPLVSRSGGSGGGGGGRFLTTAANATNATNATNPTNATNATVTAVITNTSACLNPAGISCCTNKAHTSFCDDFVAALSSIVALNAVNFVLLGLTILLAFWACRAPEDFDKAFEQPITAGDGDEDGDPVMADGDPVDNGGGDDLPDAAVVRKGKGRDGKKMVL